MLQHFRKLGNDYHVVIGSFFFMKIGQFMLLPFLAIYLSHFPGATPSKIGFVIGSSLIIYAFFSPVSGWLIDQFGSKKMIVTALILSSITLYFFFTFKTFLFCSLMNILTGITRNIFDLCTRTYKKSSFTLETQKFAFSYRYAFNNTAAAVGPLLGSYFATHNFLGSFKLISILYAVLALINYFCLHPEKIINDHLQNRNTFLTSFKAATNDRALFYLVLSCMLVWTAYSQLESTFPLYLQKSIVDGLKIYPWVWVVNASICAGFQLIISHITRNADEMLICWLGLILYSIGFLILAFSTAPFILLIAIAFISFGEILNMPMNDLLTARIAPADKIGIYYGCLIFGMLGIGIGPIIGGFIYQHFGIKTLYISFAFLVLAVGFLYKKVFHHAQHLEKYK